MEKRKRIVPLLVILLSVLLLMPVRAAETPGFLFELSVNGKSEETVHTGDVITVLLTLRRTDEKSSFTMYSMQDELRYDTGFFRLVEGGELVSGGVRTADVSRGKGLREYYMNYTDLHGGKSWAADTIVGSFQLEVIAREGSGTISNEDYLVSMPGGSGTYAASCRDVTITVSDICTDTLMTGDDSNVTHYPGREKNGGAGFRWWWLLPLLLVVLLLCAFVLMKKVEFETYCDAGVKTVRCRKGKKIARPGQIVRPGYMFGGWYRDDAFTEPFDFDKDTITENTTLYARWI